MNVGVAMAGGNSAIGREKNDFYPTPKEVTRALMRIIPPTPGEKWWEPCCGNGAMSETMTSYGADVLSTDIEPQGYGTKQDFFDVKVLPEGIRAIVTNPPFKLAEKFIRHAWQTLKVDNLALVLKATYWHAASRQPLWHECRPLMVCPLTWRPDFLELGAPTMEVTLVIWARDMPARQQTVYLPVNKE